MKMHSLWLIETFIRSLRKDEQLRFAHGREEKDLTVKKTTTYITFMFLSSDTYSTIYLGNVDPLTLLTWNLIYTFRLSNGILSFGEVNMFLLLWTVVNVVLIFTLFT